MTELGKLHLGEVDLQALTNLNDLPDDTVGELKGLLAQNCVGTLLTITSDQQGCQFESMAN